MSDSTTEPTDKPAKSARKQPAVVVGGERFPAQIPEDTDAYGRRESDDPDPDFVGARPDADALDDLEVAEHHHEGGTGHEFSPAGAHRHSGWDTPHDHPRLSPRATPPVISPDPNGARTAEYDPAAEWTVDIDCKASVDGHMLEFKSGQVVRGSVGRFLADTGGPVTSK